MLELKSKEHIKGIRKAGRIVAACHKAIAGRIAPGVTTQEIDRFVERFMLDRGATPAQKGYKGYPFATCASVNDVVCHGFPDSVPLEAGDIVTIDMVADVDGWKADSAWTYALGRTTAAADKLMKATMLALMEGIQHAYPGRRLGDVGHAVQTRALREGFQVVTSFVGHGIGRQIHEHPTVEHRGEPGTGVILEEGMVITIEPILTAGRDDVYIAHDGWTARTRDGAWSAQFEHTVAITKEGPVILTRWE
ncbi:type I methionyl aminopeptidase [Paenibacillus harenae]|uniref:Methionine aminopeptidase n=1 Tax=Paenibacillus harenae TaxID=306543 RepID=A0ABT9U5W7_PAEHA|nr:type I methionyl aminopeptidase [Paenibacillus harenae]MDQ0062435.1 methionyl aminopeptidase [Paenibacillus harenae]MDQ0114642.1 methionyl aminopeptidase [Paenibacillus harenae]